MTVFGPAVQAPTDASAAAWIAPRLGEFGTVGGLMPEGLDGCVLVRPLLVPDGSEDGALVGTLAAIAARHTDTPGDTWFAIWEGYGWECATTFTVVAGRGVRAGLTRAWHRRRNRSADTARRRRIVAGLAGCPRFDLPHRRYLLVEGPVAAAARLVEPGHVDRPQRPDLWWPTDRRWFVATDTDLDWVYVGGSTELLAEVATALPGRCAPVGRAMRNDAAGGTA